MYIQMPEEVRFALDALSKKGFQAWLIGGVRDLLLKTKPHDWDIATSALPQEIRAVFADCKQVTVGEKYGTITVFIGREPIDITTFRKEGAYKDHRHPESVVFTDNLFEDLKRRDFTINAIAFHPEKGFCDYFCGRRDLKRRLIRAIGSAEDRFEEDAIRMMRALRFASVLGFEIEEKTALAIHKKKELLKSTSPERIRGEFCRLLCGRNVRKVLTDFSDVLGVMIPEILPCIGFSQKSPYHQYDVWQHTIHAISYAEKEPSLRLALFFHDMSKPSCFSEDASGRGHFYAHPKKSAVLAREVMTRLRFPKAQIEEVCTLVTFHDSHARSESEIKWLLAGVGEALFPVLLQVMKADILAHSHWTIRKRLQALDSLAAKAEAILENGECYSLKDLAINGDDLAEIGLQGKSIGDALSLALKSVISGKWNNEKEEILSHFRKKFS